MRATSALPAAIAAPAPAPARESAPPACRPVQLQVSLRCESDGCLIPSASRISCGPPPPPPAFSPDRRGARITGLPSR